MYKAILSTNYNIESWKQYKLWKRTAAVDLQTQAQVEWMAKVFLKM